MPQATENASTSREVQRRATREAVYRAAIAEFQSAGVAGAQVSAITRAAGVAYGTFYNYFENKDAVLLESSRRTAARVREALDESEPEHCESAEAFFVQVARTHAAIAPDVPELRADVWQAAVTQPQDYTSHPHIDALARRVALLQEAGVIRADESATSIAGVFLSSLIGFLAQSPEGNTERIELLARIYAAGCDATLAATGRA